MKKALRWLFIPRGYSRFDIIAGFLLIGFCRELGFGVTMALLLLALAVSIIVGRRYD